MSLLTKPNCSFLKVMEVWGKWEFSSKMIDLLNETILKLDKDNGSQLSSDWVALLNYNSNPSDSLLMEVDLDEPDAKEEEIFNIIKQALQGDTVLLETIFIGISVNSMSRILSSVGSYIDEYGFCSFCKYISGWSFDTLIELAMNLIVLPKLKVTAEASACIIFAVKELAINKPNQFCQNVLIPLLLCESDSYTDVELLGRVFPALPSPQKDMLVLNFSKKTDFLENDWLLLYPLIKDLSQNSLTLLLECIQKFSYKFTKSQVFGRFLANFCKNLKVIGFKDVLRDVVEKHQTLLKAQALKYLESV